MGAAAQVRQGLAIKTLDVQFTPRPTRAGAPRPRGPGRLVRTSEVAVVGDPGVPAAGAQMIRQFGLKIGLRFKAAHQVVSVRWASGNALPAPAAFKTATRNETVTTLCEDLFGKAGQWWGFKIKGADITPPWSLPYPPTDDRLFFRITIDNFRPRHPMDFHEVPVAAVLDNLPDMTQHYALGVGLFTVGKSGGGLQFDTQVIAYM